VKKNNRRFDMDYIQNLERVLNKISDLDQISLLRSRVIHFWIITFDIVRMSKWSSCDHFWIIILIKMWSPRSEKRCLKNTFFDGSVPRTRQRTKKRQIFFFHRFDPPSEGGVERQYGYALQMQDIREVWCNHNADGMKLRVPLAVLVAVGMILGQDLVSVLSVCLAIGSAWCVLCHETSRMPALYIDSH